MIELTKDLYASVYKTDKDFKKEYEQVKNTFSVNDVYLLNDYVVVEFVAKATYGGMKE